MFMVQILLLIVTFLSFISWIMSTMQFTKEVNPHPGIAHCAMCQYVKLLLLLLLMLPLVKCLCMYMPHHPGRPSGVDHTNRGERRMISNFTLSRIHGITTELHNITWTLVAASVILWSLECCSIVFDIGTIIGELEFVCKIHKYLVT